jgi:hypothetical protein
MARIKALAEYLHKLTELGQEVSKGFDLNDKGHHEVPPRASGAGLDRHGAEGRGLDGRADAELCGGGRGVGEERRLLSGGLEAVQGGGGV